MPSSSDISIRATVRIDGLLRAVSGQFRQTSYQFISHDVLFYVYSCHTNGSLTFIFMPISQNNRNILHSNGHLATLTVATHPARAASARVALMGNVTIFWDETDIAGDHDDEHGLSQKSLEECFLKRHGDAKWWIPGRKPAHNVRYSLSFLW